VIVPLICQFINDFEFHATEGEKQMSLFAKIALFRWFNSAIVLSIVSHFIESISIEDGNESQKGSLVYKVYPGKLQIPSGKTTRNVSHSHLTCVSHIC